MNTALGPGALVSSFRSFTWKNIILCIHFKNMPVAVLPDKLLCQVPRGGHAKRWARGRGLSPCPKSVPRQICSVLGRVSALTFCQPAERALGAAQERPPSLLGLESALHPRREQGTRGLGSQIRTDDNGKDRPGCMAASSLGLAKVESLAC